MEAYTFCTFIGYNIVKFIRNWILLVAGIHYTAIFQRVIVRNAGSIRNGPLYTTLINCIIGAFGFACTAVDAFLRDHDRHGGTVYFWGFTGTIAER